MAIYWPTPGFKGKMFKLCVLTRWDLNFCVRSSPLRGWAWDISLSHLCKSTWYFQWTRVQPKEMILNCQIKLVAKWAVCLVCTWWLANHDLLLKSQRHINTTDFCHQVSFTKDHPNKRPHHLKTTSLQSCLSIFPCSWTPYHRPSIFWNHCLWIFFPWGRGRGEGEVVSYTGLSTSLKTML